MDGVGDVLRAAEDAARELSAYLSYDLDTARKRGGADLVDSLTVRRAAAGRLIEELRTLNPDSVEASTRTLAEVRALAHQLTHRLAVMVPDLAAARRAPDIPSVAPATLTLVAPRVRVVAYLRVSTTRQVEGFGLDVQEAAIREWARKNRLRIAFVVTDAGRSGADNVIDRPGLAEAVGHIEAERADAVVVARLDRLARDVVLQEWVRAELMRRGGQLRSAEPEEDRLLTGDPDNPTTTLVRQILGSVAQYERAMIRLRMEAGKAKKRDAGGYVGGQPPYGHRAVDHDLVPNLEEQREISRMRRWRREGKSYAAIANKLNADGVPARRGRWHPLTVSRVLNRASARKAS